MLQAFQLMLAAMVITAVTAFLVSLMIQVLCRVLASGKTKNGNDEELVALAIAVALSRSKKGK